MALRSLASMLALLIVSLVLSGCEEERSTASIAALVGYYDISMDDDSVGAEELIFQIRSNGDIYHYIYNGDDDCYDYDDPSAPRWGFVRHLGGNNYRVTDYRQSITRDTTAEYNGDYLYFNYTDDGGASYNGFSMGEKLDISVLPYSQC